MPPPDRCPECGALLIVWSYIARDGDLLFRGSGTVIEGKGEAQTRAAFICCDCDLLALFPRHT